MLAPSMTRSDRERPGRGGGARARVWRVVLLLGILAACSTYGEGSVTDWGALRLHGLGAGAGLAAIGYAAFALAEACGRLAGTGLVARVGLLAGPHGVALASTLGYGGFLLGPPAIGFLSAAVGLGPSLTTVSALALVSAALGWSLTTDATRERKRTRQTRSSGSR